MTAERQLLEIIRLDEARLERARALVPAFRDAHDASWLLSHEEEFFELKQIRHETVASARAILRLSEYACDLPHYDHRLWRLVHRALAVNGQVSDETRRLIFYVLGPPMPFGAVIPRAGLGAAEFIARKAGAPFTDPYRIAEDPEVRRQAYRRAAKRLHPDVGGDTRLMQELTAAYESLSAVAN